jgi:uncharacterized integral membrane protein (TIGR00698 family)
MQYFLLVMVCVVAEVLGRVWPMLGAPVLAILLGASLAPLAARWQIAAFYQRISKQALLGAVVLLGLGLDVTQAGRLEASTWGFMVLTVCFALASTWAFARLAGVRGPVALLVSVGTAICGGSAIAAVAGVAQAKEEETAQALSTIFMYNILAALLFPLAGRALGLAPEVFGVWAGTAINDTSSVLAASFTYGGAAGAVGMMVKMARTLMILPVSVGVALLLRYRGQAAGSWKKVLPLPALGFGLALLVRGLWSDAPGQLWQVAGTLGHGLMVLALACIGLVSHLGNLWRNGRRALLAGGLGWIALALFSLMFV